MQSKTQAERLKKAIILGDKFYNESEQDNFQLREEIMDDLAQSRSTSLVPSLFAAYKQANKLLKIQQEEQDQLRKKNAQLKKHCKFVLNRIIRNIEKDERKAHYLKHAAQRDIVRATRRLERLARVKKRLKEQESTQKHNKSLTLKCRKSMGQDKLQKLQRMLIQFRKKPPPKWYKIRSNKYPDKSWRQLIPKDEVPECICTESCGPGCLNRELYQECVPGLCSTIKHKNIVSTGLHNNNFQNNSVLHEKSPSLISPRSQKRKSKTIDASQCCLNTRIQRSDFPEIQVFRTLNRGWGLRSTCQLEEGVMVCEYVGEVIDADECQIRMEEKAALYTGPGCAICGGHHQPDRVLLCDSCDKEYHMFCLKPRLTKAPEGEWFGPCCIHHRETVQGNGDDASISSIKVAQQTTTNDIVGKTERAVHTEDIGQPSENSVDDNSSNVTNVSNSDVKIEANTKENEVALNARITNVNALVSNDAIENAKSKAKEEHPFDVYFAGLSGAMVIDAEHFGNIARFANHCCWPNCIMQVNYKILHDFAFQC